MTIVADGEEYDVSFKDGMTRWFVVFDEPVETKTITFRVDSVYKGTKSSDLCISEVFASGVFDIKNMLGWMIILLRSLHET